MPRDKTVVDEFELRITPPDASPITDWLLSDKILSLLACEEGGDGTDKRLHYHAVIKTTMSRNTMVSWIYKVARCKGESGNAVFFSRKPHPHTYGYVVKQGKVVCRHGIDHVLLDEWFAKSKEYVRTGEADRKRKQRSRADELSEVVDAVEALLKSADHQSFQLVVQSVLSECYNRGVRFPAKTQMESIANRLMFPYNPLLVECYYMRSFSNGFVMGN